MFDGNLAVHRQNSVTRLAVHGTTRLFGLFQTRYKKNEENSTEWMKTRPLKKEANGKKNDNNKNKKTNVKKERKKRIVEKRETPAGAVIGTWWHGFTGYFYRVSAFIIIIFFVGVFTAKGSASLAAPDVSSFDFWQPISQLESKSQ